MTGDGYYPCAAQFNVRRATLDDLKSLIALLKATLLQAEDLEKRFTEFQVAEAPDGTLAGALGMQIGQKQGKLHSETYADYALADILRPLLWARVQSVAQNHGLIRLWTQESAPFWKQSGFALANEEAQKKFPEAFGEWKGDFLSLKLREDVETAISLDKEFAIFMEAEKTRTEELQSHARTLKTVAVIVALGLLFFVVVGAFMLFKHQQAGWMR